MLIFRELPIATLFPYTTLFRSVFAGALHRTTGDGQATCQILVIVHATPVAVEIVRHARQHLALAATGVACTMRSEEHTSELQSLRHLVCRLLLEKKKTQQSVLH